MSYLVRRCLGGATSSSSLFGPLTTTQRFMRANIRISRRKEAEYNIDNKLTSEKWPPLEETRDPISPKWCRHTIHHLHEEEMERCKAARTFTMPTIRPGDLVAIRYELSRSQQTFAEFRGYCTEVRDKKLNSSFILKNTYDAVGVEQLIPLYSPRLLDVRNVAPLPPRREIDKRPISRNYRYKWQNYVRSKQAYGQKVLRARFQQKPGIMSLEPRIKKELAVLRLRYKNLRREAGLPPYIFPGPYNITRRHTREVKAEVIRRMMIYAHDERRLREQKLKRREERSKWGQFKMKRDASVFDQLPSYHPLMNDNLPK